MFEKMAKIMILSCGYPENGITNEADSGIITYLLEIFSCFNILETRMDQRNDLEVVKKPTRI